MCCSSARRGAVTTGVVAHRGAEGVGFPAWHRLRRPAEQRGRLVPKSHEIMRSSAHSLARQGVLRPLWLRALTAKSSSCWSGCGTSLVASGGWLRRGHGLLVSQRCLGVHSLEGAGRDTPRLAALLRNAGARFQPAIGGGLAGAASGAARIRLSTSTTSTLFSATTHLRAVHL